MNRSSNLILSTSSKASLGVQNISHIFKWKAVHMNLRKRARVIIFNPVRRKMNNHAKVPCFPYFKKHDHKYRTLSTKEQVPAGIIL